MLLLRISTGLSDLLADKCERVTCLGPLGLCGYNCSMGTAWDPVPSHKIVTGEVEMAPQ